ncbi:MAG: DUF1275 domain-containing protein [Lachnospiraceae bacterium]|nr:DUF1275 domain-containing protein [Lachnospiraceae bacterium]
MKQEEKLQTILHCSMAVIGGFLGAYGLLNRQDVFGNAQTANMMWLILCILGKDFQGTLLRIGGLLLYMAGIVCATLWSKYCKVHIHYLALVVDAIAMLSLGLLPKDMNVVLALYPVFFAAALQWCAFPGVYGYNCSTIFSTNNLRQFTSALAEYLYSHNKKYSHKAKFYGSVLFSYHFGVAISFVVYCFLGILGSFVGLGLLAVPTLLVMKEQKLQNGLKTKATRIEKQAA